MNSFRGIGLMSGTSLDGVDVAYCQFDCNDGGSWTYELLQAATVPYPKEWRARLESLQNETAETYARTDVEYGHYLGQLLADFIATHPLQPDFVASHGHTIFHQPENAFTAQIGDGETISSHLPCPLVTNFRNKDVALKGQGAPLVPFGEKFLFPDCRLFLNLGGFSNISSDGCAFDVSPCNFAMNWAVQRYDPNLEFDRDGLLARAGNFNEELFEKLESLHYYKQTPPKSLGREWFEEHFLPLLTEEKNADPRDVLRTLCHHIASQISRAVASIGIRDTKILVTGGGTRNSFLTQLIEEKLHEQGVSFETNAGPDLIDYKEALIFAFLGLQVLLGRPNILTAATGATAAAVAGSIHLPIKAERFRLFKSKSSGNGMA